MTAPHIHPRWRTFSVSDALDQLGEDLATIRKEDGLTWKEVGRVLGKSDDRASDYASGLSEMPIGAFLLGLREWNGRLGAGVLAMVGQQITPLDGGDVTDGEKLCRALHVASGMASAIGGPVTPGVIDDDELRGIGTRALEDAKVAIAVLQQRLSQLLLRDAQERARS